MVDWENLWGDITSWVSGNWPAVVISLIVITLGLGTYRLIVFQVKKLQKNEKITKANQLTIKRISGLVIFLIVFTIVALQFSEIVGIFASVLTLVGGTIIGFAAINTLGNLIAGLIIMLSKPFSIGDMIIFEGTLVDVIDVEFIYTKLEKRDKTLLVIPNQTMLKSKIVNYGKGDRVVRRELVITLDYSIDHKEAMKVLEETVLKSPGVLSDPDPRVIISNFLDYAIEYTIYYHIRRVKHMPVIDSNVKRKVFEICNEKKYDLSMPSIIKTI